jgi:hypothetical protein
MTLVKNVTMNRIVKRVTWDSLDNELRCGSEPVPEMVTGHLPNGRIRHQGSFLSIVNTMTDIGFAPCIGL